LGCTHGLNFELDETKPIEADCANLCTVRNFQRTMHNGFTLGQTKPSLCDPALLFCQILAHGKRSVWQISC
jgi:hypothetical protein